ncbi:hypothetical protein WAI453_005627 [Rhynchosporium graminicola]
MGRIQRMMKSFWLWQQGWIEADERQAAAATLSTTEKPKSTDNGIIELTRDNQTKGPSPAAIDENSTSEMITSNRYKVAYVKHRCLPCKRWRRKCDQEEHCSTCVKRGFTKSHCRQEVSVIDKFNALYPTPIAKGIRHGGDYIEISIEIRPADLANSFECPVSKSNTTKGIMPDSKFPFFSLPELSRSVEQASLVAVHAGRPWYRIFIWMRLLERFWMRKTSRLRPLERI